MNSIFFLQRLNIKYLITSLHKTTNHVSLNDEVLLVYGIANPQPLKDHVSDNTAGL